MIVADIRDAYNAGQWRNRSFSKLPSQTTGSGIWFDLSLSPGNPPPQYYFAAPMVATALARSTDGGLDHGPNMEAGYKKYLHKMLTQIVTATAAPLAFYTLDYLMFYPGIAMDTGPQSFTTNISLPRQTAGSEGRGVNIMAVEQNSYAGGAQFFVTYTNQDGVAGRVTPTVQCNTQTVAGTVVTSATATARCTGPFLPLAHGDSGVRSIEGIEFLTPDVGLIVLVLVKPIVPFNHYEITAPSEWDFLQDRGYMPSIENDAYLNFIVKPVGTLASAPIQGELTTVWSNA
jgi:hypothetical protein